MIMQYLLAIRPRYLHYNAPGEPRMTRIDFQTEPARYRHWRLAFDGPVATLVMDVDAEAGLFDGYELKLNSYDLGVDIELHDAVQRLRFEHPEVRAVVLRSGQGGRVLRRRQHPHARRRQRTRTR